ncbi:MAG: 16S rRNA processing protein RimM [Clostridia bacterium]|nr:16S rRNA processing protein RimM [Clostridia bacterium]
MDSLLQIGIIVKPQGIKGELKVKPLTDDVSRFTTLKSVLIDGKSYRVLSARTGPDVAFISLFGVNDRNVAETLRGKGLFVERKDAVKIPKDRYFIVDIIGCTLKTDDGETIGKITDVTQARTDILTVDCGDRGIMRFPFLKDLNAVVDLKEKTMVVSAKRLKEVACYEN